MTSRRADAKCVERHLADVLTLLPVLDAETVEVTEADGRVLAADLSARWSLPGADVSSMDGYAVRVADVPGVLQVAGDVPAGGLPPAAVTAGVTLRVMTGAVLPAGTEAVVPVEDTDAGVTQVRVLAPTTAGAYVRRAGEDTVTGALVLPRGTTLRPAQLAAAVAVGHAQLAVTRRPRVLVVGTGSELVAPGVRPGPAQVPDSNSVGLAAAVRACGATAVRIGAVPDDPAALVAALDGAANEHRADVVVTSGGVSMGAFDVVKAALAPLGVRFDRVAMQPGMPQAWGRWRADGPAFLGLPGNPVSALVSFELFARPLLRNALGALARVPVLRVRTEAALRSPAGRRQLLRVVLQRTDSGGWLARGLGGTGSHLLTGLAAADALLVVPEETTEVAAGTELDALPLPGWAA